METNSNENEEEVTVEDQNDEEELVQEEVVEKQRPSFLEIFKSSPNNENADNNSKEEKATQSRVSFLRTKSWVLDDCDQKVSVRYLNL